MLAPTAQAACRPLKASLLSIDLNTYGRAEQTIDQLNRRVLAGQV
jgi:hypothetical protein